MTNVSTLQDGASGLDCGGLAILIGLVVQMEQTPQPETHVFVPFRLKVPENRNGVPSWCPGYVEVKQRRRMRTMVTGASLKTNMGGLREEKMPVHNRKNLHP